MSEKTNGWRVAYRNCPELQRAFVGVCIGEHYIEFGDRSSFVGAAILTAKAPELLDKVQELEEIVKRDNQYRIDSQEAIIRLRCALQSLLLVVKDRADREKFQKEIHEAELALKQTQGV